MQKKELEIFNDLPFNFFVKDEDGEYLWANRAVTELAGEQVVGKTDFDLVWGDDAETFVAADRRALESGGPVYVEEPANDTSRGPVTMKSCKWPGQLDGERCTFGISFSTD